MSSYNQVTLIGNLGRDPELRYTPQGTPICGFTLAVNDKRKDPQGNYENHVQWFKINVWGKQAESVSQFLQKGRTCLVTGRIGLEEWTDKDGKVRATMIVNSSQVIFLGDNPQNNYSATMKEISKPRVQAAAAPIPSAEILDEDIPF